MHFPKRCVVLRVLGDERTQIHSSCTQTQITYLQLLHLYLSTTYTCSGYATQVTLDSAYAVTTS